MKFGIGQAVKRVEDKVLITGTGKFTDDIDVGEGLSAHFLRSAHAHAIVSSIDFISLIDSFVSQDSLEEGESIKLREFNSFKFGSMKT